MHLPRVALTRVAGAEDDSEGMQQPERAGKKGAMGGQSGLPLWATQRR